MESCSRQILRKLKNEFVFDGLRNRHFTCNIWSERQNGYFIFYRAVITGDLLFGLLLHKLWAKLAYWVGIWIYRIVTFPQLGEKYTDFLTNWTDTMICSFYMSTFTVMCISRYTNYLRPNDPAPWYLYLIQIIFEICLTAAVLGMVIKFLFVRVKQTYKTQLWRLIFISWGQLKGILSQFRSFESCFRSI